VLTEFLTDLMTTVHQSQLSCVSVVKKKAPHEARLSVPRNKLSAYKASHGSDDHCAPVAAKLRFSSQKKAPHEARLSVPQKNSVLTKFLMDLLTTVCKSQLSCVQQT
jgi:hypothetical protein